MGTLRATNEKPFNHTLIWMDDDKSKYNYLSVNKRIIKVGPVQRFDGLDKCLERFF